MTAKRIAIEEYRGFEIFLLSAGDLEVGGKLIAELYWARAGWDPSVQVNAPTREGIRKAIWQWWEAE